jgi:hypothetical protein
MRRHLVAVAAGLVAALPATVPLPAQAAAASTRVSHYSGAGFDSCQAPSTGTMRSWLGSPYRVMNIYIGGSQLAKPDCNPQVELNKQWVHTVRTNRWSLIPTYVGLQAPCRYNTDKKAFHASNARGAGRNAADFAVQRMKALGIGPHNPVYVDLEPYDTSRRLCADAVVNYVEAWTLRMHHHHYVAGVYAHATMGVEPIALHANPRPDDVWWALWNGDPTTSYPTLHGHWKNHRIHQYSAETGSQMTTYHYQSVQIDKDTVHADVVGPQVPLVRSGPPVVFRASPPAGIQLQERSGPHKNSPSTGTYNYGDPLPVECQTTGSTVYGSPVWDKLQDGNYVSDLYTTTPGGLSFTSGLPRC